MSNDKKLAAAIAYVASIQQEILNELAVINQGIEASCQESITELSEMIETLKEID